ncbi:nucleotidyltransferase family protein [Hymenobacter properus]|uniref:Nucleotidyltransferase family protein n=1 Tax=Hymenobacter properus TaxID=2791026 RepID=A0A931BHL6_9BACT|nr:nucleotidyltransferase family protein [Hymenobacter properus]MBF9142442.1 nucleotidyltransferase family protein [Hymenobacter properus]MBR7721249.1 nucleotidyltransferase family protein [Microvirga sp. SRT04]
MLTPHASIALLLLAAGASTRMGRPKQLLPYRGRTLLRHAAETAAASGCAPRLLLTGALHAELLPEVDGLGFAVHRNPNWATGMGSSIAAGLQALEAEHPDLTAVVVMLCDQPLLSAEVLQELRQQFLTTGQAVVASAYAGTRGVPALFARSVFDELRALDGAAGARHLLQRYVHLPAVTFAGGAVDVDTAEDYVAL